MSPTQQDPSHPTTRDPRLLAMVRDAFLPPLGDAFAAAGLSHDRPREPSAPRVDRPQFLMGQCEESGGDR